MWIVARQVRRVVARRAGQVRRVVRVRGHAGRRRRVVRRGQVAADHVAADELVVARRVADGALVLGALEDARVAASRGRRGPRRRACRACSRCARARGSAGRRARSVGPIERMRLEAAVLGHGRPGRVGHAVAVRVVSSAGRPSTPSPSMSMTRSGAPSWLKSALSRESRAAPVGVGECGVGRRGAGDRGQGALGRDASCSRRRGRSGSRARRRRAARPGLRDRRRPSAGTCRRRCPPSRAGSGRRGTWRTRRG